MEAYQSLTQLTIAGFETPFAQKLDPGNRWVKLAKQIPWDQIVGIYMRQLRNHTTGASSINPRVILGAVIIKHLKNLSDEETILEIQENVYLQYFIGYSSFSTQAPFDSSLFVEIRNRLGAAELGQINDQIVALYHKGVETRQQKETDCEAVKNLTREPGIENESDSEPNTNDPPATNPADSSPQAAEKPFQTPSEITHKGRLLIDATACPQDIAYPTDLNLLNDARLKSEDLVDMLYQSDIQNKKPRTYREEARKNYLRFAKSRQLSRKQIRKATAIQLRYLRRNIGHIHTLLDHCPTIPLKPKEFKYLLVSQGQRRTHRSGAEEAARRWHQGHPVPVHERAEPGRLHQPDLGR